MLTKPKVTSNECVYFIFFKICRFLANPAIFIWKFHRKSSKCSSKYSTEIFLMSWSPERERVSIATQKTLKQSLTVSLVQYWQLCERRGTLAGSRFTVSSQSHTHYHTLWAVTERKMKVPSLGSPVGPVPFLPTELSALG